MFLTRIYCRSCNAQLLDKASQSFFIAISFKNNAIFFRKGYNCMSIKYVKKNVLNVNCKLHGKRKLITKSKQHFRKEFYFLRYLCMQINPFPVVYYDIFNINCVLFTTCFFFFFLLLGLHFNTHYTVSHNFNYNFCHTHTHTEYTQSMQIKKKVRIFLQSLLSSWTHFYLFIFFFETGNVVGEIFARVSQS